MLLCEDLGDGEAADLVAARVRDAIESPISVHGREVGVSASVGVELVRVGSDPHGVLRDADAAMYVAKAHRRGARVRFAPAAPRLAHR